MKRIFSILFILILISPLIGEEKIVNFGVEVENITERNLIDNGGKAVITIPSGSETHFLEASGEDISSKSIRAFLYCYFRPADFLSIYGKAGFTNLDWGFTVPNPPGEPGTPPQDIKFKGDLSFVWGVGARIRIFEISGFKAELNGEYLTYKPSGKFYINGIEFEEFEEEQFRIQHGGGDVEYKMDTAVNEINVRILLSKKFGMVTPYLGGGYINMKPKSTLVMEGTPADIGYVRYDMEFNSKMKDSVYLIGGIGLNVFGPLHLNIELKTKAISTVSIGMSLAF